MQKLGWYAFQIVVALLALWWVSTWADINAYGMAPGALAMFIAWLTTGLLARFIDWLRAPRSVVVGDKTESDGVGRTLVRRVGDSPEHVGRPRVGQNIRKLP